MTGPRRCIKKGPPKPIPAAPPLVEVLPPTNRAAFVAPPELAEIQERFAALLISLPEDVDKTSAEAAAAWWIVPPALVEE